MSMDSHKRTFCTLLIVAGIFSPLTGCRVIDNRRDSATAQKTWHDIDFLARLRDSRDSKFGCSTTRDHEGNSNPTKERIVGKVTVETALMPPGVLPVPASGLRLYDAIYNDLHTNPAVVAAHDLLRDELETRYGGQRRSQCVVLQRRGVYWYVPLDLLSHKCFPNLHVQNGDIISTLLWATTPLGLTITGPHSKENVPKGTAFMVIGLPGSGARAVRTKEDNASIHIFETRPIDDQEETTAESADYKLLVLTRLMAGRAHCLVLPGFHAREFGYSAARHDDIEADSWREYRNLVIQPSDVIRLVRIEHIPRML